MPSPVSSYLDAATIRHQVAGEDVQERRLAGSVRPDEQHYVSAPEIEVDIVEHNRPAEGFPHTPT
jgi:hypothetical protein